MMRTHSNRHNLGLQPDPSGSPEQSVSGHHPATVWLAADRDARAPTGSARTLEAFLRSTALQVGFELVLDVVRQ